jgi:hypothetical protein
VDSELNGAAAPHGLRREIRFAEIPVGESQLYFTVDDVTGTSVTLHDRRGRSAARTWAIGGSEKSEILTFADARVTVFQTPKSVTFDFDFHPIASRIPLIGIFADASRHHMFFAHVDHPEAQLVLHDKGTEPWLVRRGVPVGRSAAGAGISA